MFQELQGRAAKSVCLPTCLYVINLCSLFKTGLVQNNNFINAKRRPSFLGKLILVLDAIRMIKTREGYICII